MASDGLAPCMFASTVTPLLLLFVMPLCVETVGNGAKAAVRRRNIPGMLRVNVDDLSFASVMKEVDKHVDTYVESGEFLVNKTGDNSSNFVVEVLTDPPSTEASSSTTGESTTDGSEEQLLPSTEQPVVEEQTEETTGQETQVQQQVQQWTQQQQQVQQPAAQQQPQVQQPAAQQQPQVQQPAAQQQPQVQQPAAQQKQPQVQQPAAQQQQPQVQQPKGQQQQLQVQQSTQRQPPQLQQPTKQQSKVQQQQQLQLQQSHQQGPLIQKNQPQQQKQQPSPSQRRRRHHRKVRRGDSAKGKTKMESMAAEDKAAYSRVSGRRKTGKRQRRQLAEQKTSSDSTYDKYFRKKTIDDFFRQSSGEVDVDDIAEIRAKRQNYVPNGIEVDVTMVGDYGGGLFDMQFENDLMERDVGAPELMDPAKDGTLTLNKLSSVLYSNETIDHLQLFSDNPGVSVRWEEPAMMINCWLHKMLADRYTFSPSCKPDGTYYNKQCYLERCWCVDNEGHPRDRKFLTRFAYKKFGSVLYCIPQLHEVNGGNLLLPPEEQFEMVVHTRVPTQVPHSVGIQRRQH